MTDKCKKIINNRLFYQRQGKGKGAPPANLALHYYRAAVGFYQAFRNSKTQAGAAGSAGAGFIYPVKALENHRQVFRRDAFARIRNADVYHTAAFPRGYIYLAVFCGMRQRIVQEVIQDLLDAVIINVYRGKTVRQVDG